MERLIATIAIGFASGVLSGLFGIGGGVLTTPALRLLLRTPALVAVGTPLLAIIPSAVSGSLHFWRRGVTDVRSGLLLGGVGAVTAVIGARLSVYAGGTAVLLVTGGLMLYMAGDMIVRARRSAAAERGGAPDALDSFGAAEDAPVSDDRKLVACGFIAGLYSGFLGLGGGFVLVPLLSRWLHFPMKKAIATSLTAIAILAVPGTITHALLGNVDWRIGLGLVLGVVPGAALGARVAMASSDRRLRIGFGVLLLAAGVALTWSELGAWVS